jgi:hypothetical protein
MNNFYKKIKNSNNNNMNKTIAIVIIALVAGVGGFYGGTVYEKKSLTSQGLIRNASGVRGQGGNFSGGQNGQGTPGGQGRNVGGQNRNAGGGFATGQIISKDDKSITIKMQDGGSKIVYFSDTTTVGKTASGSASDLNSGQQVVANGTANSDGSLAAQNIQIRPDQPNQQQ